MGEKLGRTPSLEEASPPAEKWWSELFYKLFAFYKNPHAHPPNCSSSFPPPLCFDYMVDLHPPFWLFLERKKKGKKKQKQKQSENKSNQIKWLIGARDDGNWGVQMRNIRWSNWVCGWVAAAAAACGPRDGRVMAALWSRGLFFDWVCCCCCCFFFWGGAEVLLVVGL